MTDDTRERLREADPAERTTYDRFMEKQQSRLRRGMDGRIVMSRADIAPEQSRQGYIRYYLNSQEDPEDATAESALQDWDVFAHEIHTQSGMHRHQGGLVIYVVRGSGYTIVGGEKMRWKAGDLLLLPVVPGGVAHQHFSDADGESAEWVAFIHRPMHDAIGSYMEQISESPDYE